MDADRDDGVEQAQALDALLLAPVISEAAAPDLVRHRPRRRQAAVAALGERALAGADEADLAAEAVERVLAALPVAGVEVRAADAPGGMLTPRTIASAGSPPGSTGSPPGEAVVPIGTPEQAV